MRLQLPKDPCAGMVGPPAPTTWAPIRARRAATAVATATNIRLRTRRRPTVARLSPFTPCQTGPHRHLRVSSFQDSHHQFITSIPLTSTTISLPHHHQPLHHFATMASATNFFDFKVKDSKPHPPCPALPCHAEPTTMPFPPACSHPQPNVMTAVARSWQLASRLASPCLGDSVSQRQLDNTPSPFAHVLLSPCPLPPTPHLPFSSARAVKAPVSKTPTTATSSLVHQARLGGNPGVHHSTGLYNIPR